MPGYASPPARTSVSREPDGGRPESRRRTENRQPAEERPDSGEGDKSSECGKELVHLQADQYDGGGASERNASG